MRELCSTKNSETIPTCKRLIELCGLSHTLLIYRLYINNILEERRTVATNGIRLTSNRNFSMALHVHVDGRNLTANEEDKSRIMAQLYINEYIVNI
jgi:hypothetical protein